MDFCSQLGDLGEIPYEIGNKMPTRRNRWFLLQILLLAQHVSGTIMPIIRSSRVLYRWLLPVVFGALVFKLSVWCGAEGYVSGLRTASPQTGHITLYNTLELLMMGIVLPETCWASNKIYNKNHLLHLVGILFPHINEDARSKSHQIHTRDFEINANNFRVIKIGMGGGVLHIIWALIKRHFAFAIPKPPQKKSWWSCILRHSQSCLTEIRQKLFCIWSFYFALINTSYFQTIPIKNWHKITMQLKLQPLHLYKGLRVLITFLKVFL